MGLYLGLQFYSIDLPTCLYTNTKQFLSLLLCNTAWGQGWWFPQKLVYWILQYFLEGGTKYSRNEISVEQKLRNGHPDTATHGDPSHIQTTNSDTIVDDKKYLLTGAWYSCLLSGSARAWQALRQILAANHCTEHKVPNGGVREGMIYLKGLACP